ncbi:MULTISPECIES: OB-fold protein [unclassified Serratia (in: enterobacteria)]|uniref:OB-fold protein n=1 Tax=unclassified Serratia (in: enterobacteria) TaxID=2647522 RepID=UPI00307671E9
MERHKLRIVLLLLFFIYNPILSAYGEGIGKLAPTNKVAFEQLVSTRINDDRILSLSYDLRGYFSNKNKLIPARISEVVKSFHRNELYAKKEYGDRYVWVRTNVSEIGEDLAGDAYIKSNGKDAFEYIIMKVDGEDKRVLSLRKDNVVDMVCSIGSYDMKVLILKSCVFTDDYVMDYYNAHFPIKDMTSPDFIPTNSLQAEMLLVYNLNKAGIDKYCGKGFDKMKCSKEHFKAVSKFKENSPEIISSMLRDIDAKGASYILSLVNW